MQKEFIGPVHFVRQETCVIQKKFQTHSSFYLKNSNRTWCESRLRHGDGGHESYLVEWGLAHASTSEHRHNPVGSSVPQLSTLLMFGRSRPILGLWGANINTCHQPGCHIHPGLSDILLQLILLGSMQQWLDRGTAAGGEHCRGSDSHPAPVADLWNQQPRPSLPNSNYDCRFFSQFSLSESLFPSESASA